MLFDAPECGNSLAMVPAAATFVPAVVELGLQPDQAPARRVLVTRQPGYGCRSCEGAVDQAVQDVEYAGLAGNAGVFECDRPVEANRKRRTIRLTRTLHVAASQRLPRINRDTHPDMIDRPTQPQSSHGRESASSLADFCGFTIRCEILERVKGIEPSS